jgi:hypothetical protein
MILLITLLGIAAFLGSLYFSLFVAVCLGGHCSLPGILGQLPKQVDQFGWGLPVGEILFSILIIFLIRSTKLSTADLTPKSPFYILGQVLVGFMFVSIIGVFIFMFWSFQTTPWKFLKDTGDYIICLAQRLC